MNKKIKSSTDLWHQNPKLGGSLIICALDHKTFVWVLNADTFFTDGGLECYNALQEI